MGIADFANTKSMGKSIFEWALHIFDDAIIK